MFPNTVLEASGGDRPETLSQPVLDGVNQSDGDEEEPFVVGCDYSLGLIDV